MFREKKSEEVIGTAPLPPFYSFGQGYNSTNIVMIKLVLDANLPEINGVEELVMV